MRSFAAVLLAGIAIAGCGVGSRGAVALTPSTELGTVVLRLTADGSRTTAGPRDATAPAVVVDAGRGRPSAEVAAARDALARLVAEAHVPRAVADRMVRIARERTRERLVRPGGSGVAGDTLLDLSIAEVGLVTIARPGEPAAPAADPALTLVVNGSLRLERAKDGVVLLARPIRHTAETKPLGVWMKDEARELRNALGPAVEALAASLVDELF